MESSPDEESEGLDDQLLDEHKREVARLNQVDGVWLVIVRLVIVWLAIVWLVIVWLAIVWLAIVWLAIVWLAIDVCLL
jgi:hypothetical protein